MKKIILTIALVASAFAAVMARDIHVDPRVMKAFNTQFDSAKEVSWTKLNEKFQATFINKQGFMNAIYNEEGKLLELNRNVSVLELSGNLQKGLKTYFDIHWVTGIVEVWQGNKKIYYATLEGPDDILMLRSKDGSEWKFLPSKTILKQETIINN